MKDRGRGVSAQLNSSANSAVTQPVQGRNARRTQQIKALHCQFEDLKKKIKDVQNKNEKIIENIHKQYDFKKKPQPAEYIGDTPIVYYQQREDRTTERSGRKSEKQQDNSESEDRETRLQNKRGSNMKKNVVSGYSQNVQSARRQQREQEMISSKISNPNNPLPRQPTPIHSNNQIGLNASSQLSMLSGQIPQESIQISPFAGLNTYPMSMQFPAYTTTFPNISMSQIPVYNPSYASSQSYQFQDQLRRERQKIKVLQKQLQNKQQQSTAFRRLQKRHGVLTIALSEQVQGMLQIFMQQVIKKKLYEIDKYVKKNDNKLKRLQMQLKDKEEEHVSKKNIEVNRQRRMQSKTKRNLSPREGNNNQIVSVQRISGRKPEVAHGSPPNGKSTSKSKQSDISKSNQQFSVIASGYEEMIKVKNRDIQILQKKLKQKEKEFVDVTSKCAKLESRIVDLAEIPKDTRQRKYSQKQDNLLANFEFDEGKEEEIKALNQKVLELENTLKAKVAELRQREIASDKITKKAADYEGKAKKLEAQLSKLREENRRQSISRKSQSDQPTRIKKLQSELQMKQKQWNVIRERCSKIQSEKIERQCENLTLGNRLNKMQNLLQVKQSKIQELQRIIESSSGNDMGDLLEKSVYLQKFDPNEIHKMQEDKQRLQEEMANQREEIYLLRKNNQTCQSRCNELVAMIEVMKKQNQTLSLENGNIRANLQERENQQFEVRILRPRMFSESERASEGEEDHAVREELQELRAKYEQTQRALKIQKHESLESTTKVIKLSSEVSYYRELLSERQSKYQKLRREFQEGRVQSGHLKKLLQTKEEALQMQRRVNMQKIKQIESQWLQFEQQMRCKQQANEQGQSPNEMMRNSRFSEDSFANYKNTFNSISAQNEQLNERIKQQQKMIDVQREMEGKIMNEYRENIEKIKLELRDKSRQNQQLTEDVEGYKRKLRSMEQNQIKAKEKTSAESRLQQQAQECNQRIVELQIQLKEVRSMQQQLFHQLSAKQQQYQSLLKVLQSKDGKIQQLQQIIELKQINMNSNISSSMQKSKMRDSLHSQQSSLRYSMVSVNKDKTMELELSEVGESFFQSNQSMMSNVSEVFAKDEFPYEKVQLKRVQQRRLFQKTAAYIKSLKIVIDQKDKRIKLLQRKIESLRNSQLVRKDIYDVKENVEENREQFFQECMSVQLQRSNSQRYRYKQLEHEAKLTIEENNLLNNQNLQDELAKAEEQQNSLMKLKDLYKDEIKSLIKQNQEQAKTFEVQVKYERQRNEDSQSVQRMQAIRQLYLKIMAVIIAIDHQVPKAKRREDRHRELQDYIKPAVRDKFLSDLKK